MASSPWHSAQRVRFVVAACAMLLVAVAGAAQEVAGAGLDEVRAFAPGELRVAELAPLRRIVVVEGGRPMPLDSYARITLLRLSGRRSYDRRPAIEWLARVLFTPNETHDDEIFLVDNPEVVDAMGLESRGRDRYSLAFLLPGLPELERLAADAVAISEEGRTIVEREILRLWNNVGVYANLLSSFAFTYPHRDFQVDDQAAAELLGLPGTGTYSYLDIALRRAELRDAAMAAGVAHAASGAFSRSDGQLLRLSQSLAAWQGSFVGLPLPVIPVAGFGETRWLTPWQALDGSQTAGLGAEQLRALETELLALRDLQVAYLEGRELRFGLAARQFTDSVQRRTAAELELKDPGLEIFYNRTNPYLAARLAYGAGLLLLALSFLGLRTWLYRASFLLLLLGFIPHTFGLVLRILITDRPPVTNLFETFVFVGWGAVVCGVVMEYLRKRYLGVFCGLAGGFVFFLLSGKFSAEGDTMPVLQAVLDTNFWLSTHVTVITTGYMACCVAGLLGHVYMLQAVLQGRRGAASATDARRLAHTYRTLFGTLALGLTFSFVGTMLGGIWADQSWGRFWGWDPKENGALLIVLWCAILFHARMGKMIGQFGMAAGAALLIIVVMLAWFGINALGVGLHSYGFTDGVLLGLGVYSVAQVAFVAALGSWYRRQQRRAPKPPVPPSPGAGVAAAGRANGAARNTAPVVGDGSSGVAAATADR